MSRRYTIDDLSFTELQTLTLAVEVVREQCSKNARPEMNRLAGRLREKYESALRDLSDAALANVT